MQFVSQQMVKALARYFAASVGTQPHCVYLLAHGFHREHPFGNGIEGVRDEWPAHRVWADVAACGRVWRVGVANRCLPREQTALHSVVQNPLHLLAEHVTEVLSNRRVDVAHELSRSSAVNAFVNAVKLNA